MSLLPPSLARLCAFISSLLIAQFIVDSISISFKFFSSHFFLPPPTTPPHAQTPPPPLFLASTSAPAPALADLAAALAALAAFAFPRTSLRSASSTSGSVAAIARALRTCHVECTKGSRGQRSFLIFFVLVLREEDRVSEEGVLAARRGLARRGLSLFCFLEKKAKEKEKERRSWKNTKT